MKRRKTEKIPQRGKAMVFTRPDIAHKVSRFLSNSGREHWKAVKWIMRYLQNTSNLRLRFGSDKPVLISYTDADMGEDADSRNVSLLINHFIRLAACQGSQEGRRNLCGCASWGWRKWVKWGRLYCNSRSPWRVQRCYATGRRDFHLGERWIIALSWNQGLSQKASNCCLCGCTILSSWILWGHNGGKALLLALLCLDCIKSNNFWRTGIGQFLGILEKDLICGGRGQYE